MIAASTDEFMDLLSDVDFVMERFSVNLVAPILKTKGQPSEGKLYSFDHHPMLGGEYGHENLEECDIEVHFSFLGQLLQQTKELPDNTLAISPKSLRAQQYHRFLSS